MLIRCKATEGVDRAGCYYPHKPATLVGLHGDKCIIAYDSRMQLALVPLEWVLFEYETFKDLAERRSLAK